MRRSQKNCKDYRTTEQASLVNKILIQQQIQAMASKSIAWMEYGTNTNQIQIIRIPMSEDDEIPLLYILRAATRIQKI